MDRGLIVAAVTLGALTAASIVAPGLQVRLFAPALDLVLDTITTMVTLAVTALAWARYEKSREAAALFQAAAFLVLAISNVVPLMLVASGLDAQAGLALAAPTQAPLYDFTLGHLYAGVLLVLGGLASLRGPGPRRPLVVLLGSTVGMLATITLCQAAAGALPALASLPAIPAGSTGSQPAMPGPTLLGTALQTLGAALFLCAAGLARRLFRRDGLVADSYLAVGLVFAAFAEFATAVNPGTYTGLVTSADLLRLAFDVSLLLGIQAEASMMLGLLQLANADLAELRVVEVQRAALEERARVSRELHDGLAQNLWLAKLKTARLAGLPDLGPEGRTLAGELGTAIDAGLDDAQQAVAALRVARGSQESLGELMTRMVDDFADRFGLRAEFECEPDLPPLSPRAQAEALRVAQEALNNVRRHADATIVRVRAGVEGGRLVVTIRDNGCGFDPATVYDRAFGLTSMRERAALLGGELRIESRPQGGTRIRLFVPLPATAPPMGVR